MTGRIPIWAYVVAFAVQAGLLGYMIADRALLISNGKEIRLNVVPVDPRDFFRGDYVILSYPLSRLVDADLAGDEGFNYGEPIFVGLVPDGETWRAASLHRTLPESGMALRGIVTNVTSANNCTGDECGIYSVDYNIEKFFVPEGEGRALETLRNDQRMQVDVALSEKGQAALKRLRVDGEVRYEESLF